MIPVNLLSITFENRLLRHDHRQDSTGHGRRTGVKSPGQSAYALSGSSVSFSTEAPYFAATSLTG
jgi:hypothetical protein